LANTWSGLRFEVAVHGQVDLSRGRRLEVDEIVEQAASFGKRQQQRAGSDRGFWKLSGGS
jgi:hypothetical protein